MYTCASQLKDQGVFRHIGVLATKVFDFLLVLIAEIVKTQTVFLCIHNGTKFGLQLVALGCIQQTLKYRILYPLAVVDAFLCNFFSRFRPAASSVFTS